MYIILDPSNGEEGEGETTASKLDGSRNSCNHWRDHEIRHAYVNPENYTNPDTVKTVDPRTRKNWRRLGSRKSHVKCEWQICQPDFNWEIKILLILVIT